MKYRMRTLIKGWICDQSGVTAMEYGLLAAGIALALVAAIFALGGDVTSVFESMDGSMQDAATRVSP